MIFQPFAALFIIWKYFFHMGPETRRVIHLFSVTELMNYNVIYYFVRGIHKKTVEVQVSFRTAASPATLLHFDSDAAIVNSDYVRIFFYLNGNYPFCFCSKKLYVKFV